MQGKVPRKLSPQELLALRNFEYFIFWKEQIPKTHVLTIRSSYRTTFGRKYWPKSPAQSIKHWRSMLVGPVILRNHVFRGSAQAVFLETR